MSRNDSIDATGFPLAFLVAQGAPPRMLVEGEGRDVFRVEARTMATGHQKELLVQEGRKGPVWRLVSDEGPNLKGTDLAPFPLAYFNAGLQGDFITQLLRLARERQIGLAIRDLALVNQYYFAGSFFKGTGHGSADPAEIGVAVESSASASAVTALVGDALAASPAHAALAIPLTNTFGLYVNGRRCPVTRVAASEHADRPDPYKVHDAAPKPVSGHAIHPGPVARLPPLSDTGAAQVLTGEGRVPITIRGTSEVLGSGAFAATTVYPMSPGARFKLVSHLGTADQSAPSGLAYAAAGIAFCYLTQLTRYIEYRKHKVRAIRLVQEVEFSMERGPGGTRTGGVRPVDTHVFMNGDDADEVMQNLLEVAENTCYLHAALRGSIPSKIKWALR